MTSSVDINRQFFDRVNQSVAKLNAARRMYPPSYVDTVLLPQHERDIISLVVWKDQQLSRVTGFSRANGFFNAAKVPRAVNTAFQQAYQSKVAEINAIAKSAIASAKEAYRSSTAATDNQLKQLERETNTKLNQANKLRDSAAKQALHQAINQARQTARADKDTAKTVMNQKIAVANADQQTAIRNLNSQYSDVLNQSYQPPPVTGGGGPPSLPPGPGLPTIAPPGTTFYFDPTTNSYIPSNQVVSAPQNQPPTTVYVSPSSQSGGPALESYNPIPGAPDTFDSGFDFFDALFGWMSPDNYNDYTPPANPSAVVGPVSPNTPVYTQPPQEDQLDVFDTDPWQFGFGASSAFINRSILQLNNMPVIPPKSYGFSQWAALAGAIIQAGTSIGAAAATAALSPKPKSDTSQQNALLQMQLAQRQQAQTNYTPWLIGGGIAAIALVLVMSRKK